MSLSGSIKLIRSSSSSNGSERSGSTRSTNFRFLSWSTETYTPREFVERFSLPRVVRVRDAGTPGVDNLDLHQPIMLYKAYRSTKVHGKSLKLASALSGKWKETGPTIVIPDSYTGWFSLVSDAGQSVAPCFSSIAQIATAHVPYFLTRFDVLAYRLVDAKDPSGKTLYSKTTVRAGQILQLLGVFQDLNARRNDHYPLGGRMRSRAESRGLPDHKPGPNELKYAQCLNHRNEVIFIPFSAMGQFYAAATRGSRSHQHVYQLGHLLRTHPLPLKVRLIYGYLPSAQCHFTGTLLLEKYQREDVILACAWPSSKERTPTLLEIDLDSHFRLYVGQDEQRLAKAQSYQSILTFCSEQGEFWRQQMKVTHDVFEEKAAETPPHYHPLQQQQEQQHQQHQPSRHITEIQTMTLALSLEDIAEEDDACDVAPRAATTTCKSTPRFVRPQLFRSVAVPRPERRQRAPLRVEEPPYCRVVDDVTEEENIYAEICDPVPVVMPGSSRQKNYLAMPGGSDGGTFSSSDPSTTLSRTLSSPEEDDEHREEFMYYSVR